MPNSLQRRALVAVTYEAFAQFISRDLTRMGFEVLQCTSAEQLMNQVTQTSFHAYVIELEFGRPRDLAEQARSLYSHIRDGIALFLTHEPATADRCRREGIGCVTKLDFCYDHLRKLAKTRR